MAERTEYDLLFIPGGDSALEECTTSDTLEWIREVSANAERVMAVCTGTIVLGTAGGG